MKKTAIARANSNRLIVPWAWGLAILAGLLGFQPRVQAAKVLVVSDLGQRDSAKFVDILTAQGHEVTVLNTGGGDTVDTAETYAAAGYDLLIVDEVINSSALDTRFARSPIPVVSMEAYILRSPRTYFSSATSGGSNYGSVSEADTAGANYGQIMGETSITITDAGHPLAAGLPAGNVQIWDTSIDTNKFVIPSEGTRNQGVVSFIGSANLVAGITKVAEVPDGPNYWCVWVAEPGLTLSDGSTNQARWVHMPWNDSLDGRVMQEPSFFLFEAGVAYALGLPQPTKIRDMTAPAVFAPTNTPIAFSVDKTTAGGSEVATIGISLTVNGVDVTGDLSIADGDSTWDVTYANGFAPDDVYTIVASATAADGGTSARQTRLDTLDPAYFTVEAEDYNYTENDGTNDISGLFFDNPILCTNIGGGIDGCYFDRNSTEGVDRHKGNTRLTTDDIPYDVETYRFGPESFRTETMDTYVSFDWAVQARAERESSGIADYEVRNIGQNDWQNYTRTYPTGKFNIYLRMLSSSTNGTVQLDLVDDPVAPTDITTMGTFLASGIGPQLVPMTDANGNANIVVELTDTGPTTLRLTQLSGGWNMQGYFVLVPSEAEVNQPPTVSIDSPADGTTVSEGDATIIEATATDDGTITNVQFFANAVLIGEDDTAPYTAEFTPAALGAVRTVYTIEVVAADDGSLTGSDTLTVNAVDPSYIFVSTAVGDGADIEMVEQNDPTAGRNSTNLNTRATTNRNELVGLRIDLTGYDLSAATDVSLNLVNFRNNSGRLIDVYGLTQGASGGSGAYTTETWSDTNVVAWGDMPGLLSSDADISSPSIDTNNLTLLVDDLGVGATSGLLDSINSPELTSFVQGYTGSSSITFLIRAGNDSSGQFRAASKEATELADGGGSGSAGDFAPFLAFRIPATTVTIDSFSLTGDQSTLSWSGGAGPFTVQKNVPLSGTWSDLQTGIAGTSATVTNDTDEGYYRVVEP